VKQIWARQVEISEVVDDLITPLERKDRHKDICPGRIAMERDWRPGTVQKQIAFENDRQMSASKSRGPELTGSGPV